MRDVTIYRHNDGTARFKEWIVPNILWAEIMTFTKLDAITVNQLVTMTKERAHVFLDDYIPKLW